MSPLWAHGVGVVTVLLMLVFVALWIWAWLPHHQPDFTALARLPLDDADGEPGDDEAVP